MVEEFFSSEDEEGSVGRRRDDEDAFTKSLLLSALVQVERSCRGVDEGESDRGEDKMKERSEVGGERHVGSNRGEERGWELGEAK